MTPKKRKSKRNSLGTVARRIALKTGVPLAVVKMFVAISDPRNAHVFSMEYVRKAFAHVKPESVDAQSRHVTAAGGNIFEDLGFPTEEAARLLAEADLEIEDNNAKET